MNEEDRKGIFIQNFFGSINGNSYVTIHQPAANPEAEQTEEASDVSTIDIEATDAEAATATEAEVPTAEAHTLPDELRTPQAEALMAKLVAAGLLDEKWQPVGLSNTQKAVLVDEFTSKCKIKRRWKVFGCLWGMNSNTLCVALTKALEQQGYDSFLQKAKSALN